MQGNIEQYLFETNLRIFVPSGRAMTFRIYFHPFDREKKNLSLKFRPLPRVKRILVGHEAREKEAEAVRSRSGHLVEL